MLRGLNIRLALLALDNRRSQIREGEPGLLYKPHVKPDMRELGGRQKRDPADALGTYINPLNGSERICHEPTNKT